MLRQGGEWLAEMESWRVYDGGSVYATRFDAEMERFKVCASQYRDSPFILLPVLLEYERQEGCCNLNQH